MLRHGFFPELDPDRVERLRDVSANIGKAYRIYSKNIESAMMRENTWLIGATYFRKAAANSLLLGEGQTASELFQEAAICYREARMPYSIVMDSMAGKRRESDFWLRESPSAQNVYLLIDALGRDKRNKEESLILREKMEEYRGKRIGIFAIPVERYLDLFDTVKKVEKGRDIPIKQIREALLPFVEMYSSALVRARRDMYHWKRLAMSFHPVEPDIVGLLLMVIRSEQLRELPPEVFLKDFPVNDEAIAVLLHCIARPYKKEGRKHEE